MSVSSDRSLEKKKSRSSNFTKEEELLLLSEIYKERAVVECKTTNKYSIADKEKTWALIANRFNAKNSQCRTVDQLRSKYDNLKTKARKEVSKKRVHFRGTGGGPSTDDSFDAVIEAVLKIINWTTVAGIVSLNDCDIHQREPPRPLQDVSLAFIPEVMNIESIEVDEVEVNVAATGTGQETVHVLKVGEAVEPEEDSYVHVHVADDQPSATKKAAKRTGPNMDWGSYNARKMKTPINRKLRPTRPNPVYDAKERYYDKKAEYYEAEADAKRKWTAREEEEHGEKMELLDLEIQIKREQLKKSVNM